MVEKGLLSEADADRVSLLASERGLRIADAVRRLELTSSQGLCQFLAEDTGIPYHDISQTDVAPNLLHEFPPALLEDYRIIPVSSDGFSWTIAVPDPTHMEGLDAVRFHIPGEIQFICCEPEAIEDVLRKNALLKESGGGDADDGAKLVITTKWVDEGEAGGEEDVVRFVDEILSKAISNKASDIHVEPLGDGLRIRFRIDGVCYDKDYLNEARQGPVVARLKILAGMDITEKRLPQEGRIEARAGAREIDVRVSSLPTNHGESMVMRILDRSSLVKGIRDLGFSEADHKIFLDIIKRPDGIVLVTGPTGSGKTTTLYSALRETRDSTVKTVTVEDPVEFTFDGITQIPVQNSIGMDFPRSLRHILRHDPDVILVGEIRDLETSETAMRAALTGHKVYSTLHTNDAPSAITRLLDLGAEPFLVVASVQACMSQRLVRRLCDACKRPQEVTSDELLRQGFPPVDLSSVTFFQATGCPRCHHTGYTGRIGIFEIMDYTDAIKTMTLGRTTREEVRRQALKEGMHSLRLDGFEKAQHGRTSLSEVMRVAQKEETDMELYRKGATHAGS
jgi:type IV pilus assembly protein PilB